MDRERDDATCLFLPKFNSRGVVYQTLPVGVLACINMLIPVKEKAEQNINFWPQKHWSLCLENDLYHAITDGNAKLLTRKTSRTIYPRHSKPTFTCYTARTIALFTSKDYVLLFCEVFHGQITDILNGLWQRWTTMQNQKIKYSKILFICY